MCGEFLTLGSNEIPTKEQSLPMKQQASTCEKKPAL
jgi:hypothetical protein